MAAIGAVFHLSFGIVNATLLRGLLLGGIPGALIGCIMARHLLSRAVRKAILLLTTLLGLSLLIRGARLLV